MLPDAASVKKASYTSTASVLHGKACAPWVCASSVQGFKLFKMMFSLQDSVATLSFPRCGDCKPATQLLGPFDLQPRRRVLLSCQARTC